MFGKLFIVLPIIIFMQGCLNKNVNYTAHKTQKKYVLDSYIIDKPQASSISIKQPYTYLKSIHGYEQLLSNKKYLYFSTKNKLQIVSKNNLKIVKTYSDVPQLYLDKHKALQIVINLISNAKHALIDSDNKIKTLNINISREDDVLCLEVKDTGVGIESKDINHLFEYGFKKRRDGHGFGLHHSGIVANAG